MLTGYFILMPNLHNHITISNHNSTISISHKHQNSSKYPIQMETKLSLTDLDFARCF